MADPDGTQRLYLSRGEETLDVTVGTRLDDGYVVTAIEADTVQLHYPPLDVTAVIPIPAAPEAASR